MLASVRTAGQRMIALAEQEERIGLIRPLILDVAAQATAERGAAQIVAGQVGSHGVRNARLDSRRVAHSL